MATWHWGLGSPLDSQPWRLAGYQPISTPQRASSSASLETYPACFSTKPNRHNNSVEFLALSFSEVAGAFLGAVLVWLCYLPHFNIMPDPPSIADADPYYGDPLLGGGAYHTLTPTHLAVGGYNSDPLDRYLRRNPGQALKGTMRKVLGTMRRDPPHHRSGILQHPHRVAPGSRTQPHALGSHPWHGAATQGVRHEEGTLEEMKKMSRLQCGEWGQAGPPTTQPLTWKEQAAAESASPAVGAKLHESLAEVRYAALLIAKQNIKLGIFATQPAIYALPWNFTCEFMATVTLLLVANLVAARGNTLPEPARGLFGALYGFMLGFIIFLIVLVLGGPTGVATNPARDLGPRIAHWILPIPGKWPSQFLTYGWIPVIAPLCGGAAAGGLFVVIQRLTTASDVPAGSMVCEGR
ncbi:hypothetical protein ACKKBG_A02120 [Auxenochlorella protothecoides x Auxenochlorella symbiontica]